MKQRFADGEARLGTGHGGRRINLVRLAETQRVMIWFILVRLAGEAGWIAMNTGAVGRIPTPMVWLLFAIYVAVQLACAVLVARTARAYGLGWLMSILGAAVTLIAFVGLITAALLNQRVVDTLKKAGATVGFMGVSAEEMSKLREGVCRGCGYDLRGLAPGVCPECGAAVAPRDVRPAR